MYEAVVYATKPAIFILYACPHHEVVESPVLLDTDAAGCSASVGNKGKKKQMKRHVLMISCSSPPLLLLLPHTTPAGRH